MIFILGSKIKINICAKINSQEDIISESYVSLHQIISIVWEFNFMFTFVDGRYHNILNVKRTFNCHDNQLSCQVST